MAGYIRSDYIVVTHRIIVNDAIYIHTTFKNSVIRRSKITRDQLADGPMDRHNLLNFRDAYSKKLSYEIEATSKFVYYRRISLHPTKK